MKNKNLTRQIDSRSRRGIVLLLTLVVLVVLSVLGYTLSSSLAAWRHRQQYIIDYQAARYGCDSAARYALAKLQDINTPQLIERPNEPDFSDLFTLNEVEYKQLLVDWAANKKIYGKVESSIDTRDTNDTNDVNGLNRTGQTYNITSAADFNDPDSLMVRGPYGPSWPFITQPVEFEIGSAKVKVEIEDENAKYPLGWMLLDDEEIRREASAGLETFCEWMEVNDTQIDSLKQELKGISEIKTFKIDFEPVTTSEKKETKAVTIARRGRRSKGSRKISPKQAVEEKITIPASVHSADFVKLFHSSLIDAEPLARPTIISGTRKESALKYMGLWASSKVNINTAPRQVLESAFTFGGDADRIAEEIIRRRRIKPFADIEDLRKSLLRYSDSIKKSEKYITTASTFFTVRITATSGVAQASTIIAVTKNGEKIEKIAVISGREAGF
ncbi:MAG: type II secretion system protein GspK [Phycisphaerae bacterium]|nr:type II secretion system protein GspK [Phycisphaerae bacterium]